MPPVARTPECGHPDRKHQAKGKCMNCYSAQQYRDRTAAYKAKAGEWKAANRERVRELNASRYRKERATDPTGEAYWRQHIWQTYGLAMDEYDGLLDRQGGVCAICRNPETAMSKTGDRVRRMVVDHDHETGRVRGLLCTACNTGVGCFRDNPSWMAEASTYVYSGKVLAVQ